MHTTSKPPSEELRLSDFDFPLPEALIAQYPAAERSRSRLMCVENGSILHRQFTALPDLLAPGDLLVRNDTRVIKARLFGHKDSGGAVEILIERVLSESEVLAQMRVSKKPRAGSRIRLPGEASAVVLGRQDEFFHLRFEGTRSVATYLEEHGRLPLPPYITHDASDADTERYQTVYSRHPGAVAAPTAGLHFDDTLLGAIARRGVATADITLHVGAGTFQPVREDRISEHRMHAERYSIPMDTATAIARTRASGGRVIAVGTTTLRALESAANEDGSVAAGGGETRIFITPGYRFRVVDRLITNFHLPRSTLLMLVSAFAGMENIRQAYRTAVAERYRFFSYGDAMLLDRLREPLQHNPA